MVKTVKKIWFIDFDQKLIIIPENTTLDAFDTEEMIGYLDGIGHFDVGSDEIIDVLERE